MFKKKREDVNECPLCKGTGFYRGRVCDLCKGAKVVRHGEEEIISATPKKDGKR